MSEYPVNEYPAKRGSVIFDGPTVLRDRRNHRTLARGIWYEDRWLRINKLIVTSFGLLETDEIEVVRKEIKPKKEVNNE